MRRPLMLATIYLAIALPGGAHAEALSKTFRHAVPAKAGGTIALENLAGTLEVVAGQGTEVVLTGTAYADAGSSPESQRLIEAISVDVKDGGDRLILHVNYPVDRSPFRYRRERDGSSHWPSSSSTVDYQGRRVKVTSGGSSSPLLYADLKLEVPPGGAVYVTNHVGLVLARGIRAGLDVRTASADVGVDDVAGALKIRTGSGDIRVGGSAGLDLSTGSGDIAADRVQGAVDIATGSGDVKLGRAAGEKVSVQTGSGDVLLDDVAGSLELQTGSGDIDGRALREVERLEVETGSGQVTLSLDASKLAGGEVQAASGDVDLSLVSAAALTLAVSTASGEMDVEGLPGTSVVKRTERRLEAEVKGGGAALRVHTASGNVRVR